MADMPSWFPVNVELMKQPLNWFTVFFMVLIPLIAVALIAPALAPASS
jgi:phosphatidylglycerophosphate synthase